MRCASCKGVAHPATGHQHSARVLICGPCARSWAAWLAKHTRRKMRVGPRGKGSDYFSFYDRVGKRETTVGLEK